MVRATGPLRSEMPQHAVRLLAFYEAVFSTPSPHAGAIPFDDRCAACDHVLARGLAPVLCPLCQHFWHDQCLQDLCGQEGWSPAALLLPALTEEA
eukprot:13870617-Alexandrium_andersonii.AAC.1